MSKKSDFEQKLADLGFEVNWSQVSTKGYWSGMIDPIGRMSIAGECRGIIIHAAGAPTWYREALKEARDNYFKLVPCTDPDCEFHEGYNAETDQS